MAAGWRRSVTRWTSGPERRLPGLTHNAPAVTAVALRRPPPDARQLQRCLLLAVLLHVWLVLMFGNATGTAAPGEGVWGSLTVKLLGRSGGDPGAPPGEEASRSTAPAGAAQLGRQNPHDVPPEAARSDEPSPAPPSTATLELPEGFRPIERQDLGMPPPTTPSPLPTPDLPSAAIGRLEARLDAVAPLSPAASLRSPSPTTEALPRAADLPAPVSRLEAAPAPSPVALPRPADLRAAPPQAALAPSAELPAPVQRLEAPATAVTAATLPRAADLRAAPTAANTLPTAADLPAAVQRLEAQADAAAATPTAPLPRPSELRTASPAAATALPGTQDLPASISRLESADAASGVAPLQRAADARGSVTAPGASALSELAGNVPGEVSAPAGPARGDPNASPYAAPKASAGSPDAGPRLGPNLPSPPTAAASAPRAPLNLSLPRGDMTSRRSPGLIDLIPPPPERKSKLEQAVEEATNKDCRKAYSGAGILAVVPLAVDAVRGKGCKW
jgi:hypothetical protein